MLTLTASSGHLTSLREARIYYAVVERSTIGAAHIRAQASARAQAGQRSMWRSSPNQTDERFQVGCLGKHVEADHAVDSVALRRGESEIACERRRVT
jgi:hypothetical protein